MKAESLRKKNIFGFSLIIVLIVAFVSLIFYSSDMNKKLEQRVTSIKSETAQIVSQTQELQSKTMELKKYKALWPTLSENKKNTGGIKMDDVNSKLNSFAEKYTILSPVIKVSLPENLAGGLFERSTIIVLFTTIDLSFEAVDDARALGFLTEFVSSLTGYAVVNKMDMIRNKSYTNQDLVQISVGKGSGAIKCNTTISWYAFKEKAVAPLVKTGDK